MGDNVKKVAVLGSSTIPNDDLCDDGRSLGGILAQQEFAVILPGDLDCIKGDVSLGVLYEQNSSEKGSVVNVYADPGSYLPHQPNLNDELIDKVIVEGLKGVKDSLNRRADVAVLLPGGVEELDQAMHLMRKGMPLIIVNTSGFYAGLGEQIETLKENSEEHGVPWNHLEHVHMVSDVEEVAPIVDLYNAKGTPQHDYAARWSEAKAEDRVLRLDREKQEPGYSSRKGQNILADGAGIIALDRATTALVTEQNIPMVIDNSQSHFDGLLAQFQTMIDEGAEKESTFHNIDQIPEGETVPKPFIDMNDRPDLTDQYTL